MFVLAEFAVLGCANPMSGEYLFEYVGVTTDCPAVEIENEPMVVEVADDGETVTIGGLECLLDGTTFTCESSF